MDVLEAHAAFIFGLKESPGLRSLSSACSTVTAKGTSNLTQWEQFINSVSHRLRPHNRGDTAAKPDPTRVTVHLTSQSLLRIR
jgi:hypothetical protein